MAVKHSPSGVVHQGNKGGRTGCGFDTTKHRTPITFVIHYAQF